MGWVVAVFSSCARRAVMKVKVKARRRIIIIGTTMESRKIPGRVAGRRPALQNPEAFPYLREHFQGAVELGLRMSRGNDGAYSRASLRYRRESDSRGEDAFFKQGAR